ncbi:unnamed protein product [Medioppia subpectinata]|uniref:C2H2-type domain-containing protein n=1 Tax=Medioppia subpectinata TaxID=1979941 RepID=A0A7R9PWE1_9ACAR|nr:unnamed protein product [Medioppia subpectinata]CAG2103670.1 unnamed protein product [Medioppia subpectinata]
MSVPSSGVMHVDEFIFNCCVSSMIADEGTDTSGAEWSSSSSAAAAMNVFSIDENKIRDGNGIIFAEAITCYKCTFCGKMFAAMEVVLTHYQSNHRCSVIPLLKGLSKLSTPKLKAPKYNFSNRSQSPQISASKVIKTKKMSKTPEPLKAKVNAKSDLENSGSNKLTESAAKNLRHLRESTKNVTLGDIITKKGYNKRSFKCHFRGCSLGFIKKAYLESHLKSHKKMKSYKCEWSDCQFKCSDLAGFEFHKKSHSGDNPYKCCWPGCDHSFADSTAKDEHMQSQHIGDRILECDYAGCGAKFKLAVDRDRHKQIHSGKKISAPPKLVNGVAVRGRGRPPIKRKTYIEISSSSESSEEESEDEEEEEGDEAVVDTNKKDKSVNQDIDSDMKCEPLDLSKTGSKLINETNKSLETKSKTPSKRGRKRKEESISEKKVSVHVFRCDYPGCRKTFTVSDLLKDHERDAHNTPAIDGRSRYGRRCKGNLYYKL